MSRRPGQLSAATAALVLVSAAACSSDADASYCERLDQISQLDATVLTAELTPDEGRVRLAEMETAFEELAAAAPPEISDEVGIISRWTSDLVAVVNRPPSDDPLDIPAALSALDSAYPGLEAALVAMTEHGRRECGWSGG